MLLQDLENRGLINPPSWLSDNTQYLTLMGSRAYATNNDDSDFDIYGVTIPRKEDVFPHLKGQIRDFNEDKEPFKQWQTDKQKIFDQDAAGGKGREYDFKVFSIVRYFRLALENNPDAIDSLFTSTECVLHITQVGNLIRDNRQLFLHKGIVSKLRAYAMSQLTKAGSQNRTGKRAESVAEIGWDTKFLSHVVRLAHECHDILENHDLDLRKHKEHVKAVKKGEVTIDEVRRWFEEKSRTIEKLYQESTLRTHPDEGKIKNLLLRCLETHYGSLEKCISEVGKSEQALAEIREVLTKYGVA